MKKRILAVILIASMAVGTTGCGLLRRIKEEVMKEEVIKEEVINQEASQVDEEALFKEYLEEILEPKYGVFNKSQTGNMYTWDNSWLNPAGVMSSTILDFDSDHRKEMLVFYTDIPEGQTKHMVYMDMYEIENDEVVLADNTRVSSWHELTYDEYYGSIQLSTAQSMEVFLNVTVVKDGDEYLIVFENRNLESCFADGGFQNYWIMSYESGEIQYEASFSQNAPGSAGFEFMAYDFEEGQVAEKELYYADWSEEPGKYSYFGTAVDEFFEEHDIEVLDKIKAQEDEYGYEDFFGSVLAYENEMIPVFKFTNQVVSADYNVFVYGFKAELITE